MAVDGAYDPDGFLVWWGAHVEQTLGSIDGLRRGARPEDRACPASWGAKRDTAHCPGLVGYENAGQLLTISGTRLNLLTESE